MALHLNYGGTFDPVHHGHLAVARALAQALQARVHLVPCADPPHRPPPGASAAQRVGMLRLALDHEPLLALDLREIRRAGASYTVETLRALREELGPDAPIAFAVGADAARGLPGWRDWTELPRLAHIVVMTRPGHALDALPPALQALFDAARVSDPATLHARPAGAVLELAVPAVPVSSTQVRRQCALGAPLDGLVPPAVAAYIRAHGLYRAG